MEPLQTPRRILIVEDDPDLAYLMEKCVVRCAYSCTIALTGAAALSAAREQEPSLLLLDLRLPDMDGGAILDALAESGLSIPFIVVSGQDDPHRIIEFMKRGARDFLIKDTSLIESLPPTLSRAFEQIDRDRRLIEAEARIREQHHALQTVLDALPHPLYLIDARSYQVRVANRAASQAGHRAFSLVLTGRPEETALYVDSPVEEVRRTRAALSLEHVHYDGHDQASVHEIHVHPLTDDSGEVRQVIEYDLDVTAHKRVEQALRESEARLRQVLESLPIILASRDATTGQLNLLVGAVREIAGFEPHRFVENPAFFFDVAEPQDVEAVRPAIRGSIEAQRPFEIEFRVRHGHDGRTVWLHAQGAPIFDEDGNLLRVDAILVDITREKQAAQEREQLESRLQQAQRLESLGVLAGGIAHDFSNLLTIIGGNAQYLRESLEVNPAQLKALTDIETAARNASDLTRSLQAFSRPSKPQIVQADANALIQEVYRFLRRLIPVRIDFRFRPTQTPCMVAVDPAQIQQVLINLCINARDAIAGEGRMELRTRRISTHQLPGRLRHESDTGHYVEIELRDNGCGMDDRTLQLAFDPFFTTKPKDQATGLGLAIVYKIVAAHRGMVDVSSEPGRGTQFRVYLPQLEDASPASGSAPTTARGTERVLVVDDEQMIASLIKTVLESHGYQVAVAHRPETALELAEAAVEPMDLAVVDYGLPGMSGDKCLARLRERWPNLKALLITGYQMNESELGMRDVHLLQKPFSSQSIIDAVRAALDRTT